MSNKVDKLISNYLDQSGLQLEQLPPLPLPDQAADVPGAPPADVNQPAPAVPVTEPEEVEVEVAGADVVSSVKTMLELLSYGLHADDDVIHRNPISKWLRMRTDDGINKDNALDILQQIDDFLRAEG